jgi:mycoredoxin-dependent peroxiredoxin
LNIQVGQIAPDFTLPDIAGEPFALSSLRGKKVVLMFFPFAFTGVCTSELCAIRDNENDFIDADTVVVSVSCDSRYTLQNFVDAENFNHIFLSDFWPHGEVSKTYGVFNDERGMAIRGTFILDREGVVRWSVENQPPTARSTAEYKVALSEIA